MQSTNIPTKIPLPFAYAATGSYIATIPTASQIGVTNGKASLHDGFPPLTFTPISTGGVPPFGADFNGILNEITAITQWQQAGGFFPYDSAFSTTVGGYPKGAVILSSSFNGFWLSSTENNTTNPDTGGAGWVATAFQGLQSIAMSSTSVTMTTLQAAYPIVTITGTLTANSTLIVPSQVNEWIFSNQTSGAYTLTVKTAAGTGVVITAGSSQYTWSDGTNVYFANASAVTSFNTRTGAIVLNSTDVVSALGFTPYNATNPAGFITAPTGLGWGGTSWQNVTGSRAFGTTYTNSTGNPIQVTVTNSSTGGVSAFSMQKYINGSIVGGTTSYAANASYRICLDLIVPNGATYYFDTGGTGGTPILQSWWELR